jgi:hypothetical protein
MTDAMNERVRYHGRGNTRRFCRTGGRGCPGVRVRRG